MKEKYNSTVSATMKSVRHNMLLACSFHYNPCSKDWNPILSHFIHKRDAYKVLAPLSPQPPLKLASIQSLRNEPFSSLPPPGYPEIPVARRILRQFLHFLRRGAIFPLASGSRFVGPPCENARSSLVPVSDADLEGVVVEPSNS